MDVKDKALLDKKSAGEYLDVSVRTVERLVSTGVLKPLRTESVRKVLFRKSDLDDWVAGGCRGM